MPNIRPQKNLGFGVCQKDIKANHNQYNERDDECQVPFEEIAEGRAHYFSLFLIKTKKFYFKGHKICSINDKVTLSSSFKGEKLFKPESNKFISVVGRIQGYLIGESSSKPLTFKRVFY